MKDSFDRLFGEFSESEQERYFLSLLKPEMKTMVGKRSLNEILGSNYNFHDKTTKQILADIKNNL